MDPSDSTRETLPAPPLLPPESFPPVIVRRKPWGFWKVIGATVMIFGGGLAAAVLVFTIYLGATLPRGARPDPALLKNTSFTGLIYLVMTPVMLGLCWFYAGRCQPGRTAAEFLGLKRVPLKSLLGWCGATLLLCCANDGVSFLAGKPIVPEVMITEYLNADPRYLLLIAVVVLAPLLEETVMRGFLLEGLRHTKVGVAGAVALSAGSWAVMHIQYDWYGITSILTFGILLGIARHRTGSIYPVIAMHALSNLGSTIELLIVLARRH